MVDAGVINTPLGRHVYGESYVGSAMKLAVGILAWPWFKSPAQGAATTITAAVSPDMEDHSGKRYRLCQECMFPPFMLSRSSLNEQLLPLLQCFRRQKGHSIDNACINGSSLRRLRASQSVFSHCLWSAGAYLHDSQIKIPTTAAQDMDMAAELWAETEKRLGEAESKLKA